MTRFLVSLGLVILLSRCSSDLMKYSLIVFNEDGIGFFNQVQVEGKYTAYLETGNWKIYDNSGQLVESGKYQEGVRVGKWSHHIGDTSFAIEWGKREKKSDLLLSVPKHWNIIDSEAHNFFASFGKEDSIITKDCFSILRHDSTSIAGLVGGNAINKYCKYFEEVITNSSTILEHSSNLIELNSGKSFQLLRFVFNRNGEVLESLSLIGLHKSSIVDCTLLNSEVIGMKSFVQLLGIVRGLSLNGDRFFSPFDIVKSVNGIPIDIDKTL